MKLRLSISAVIFLTLLSGCAKESTSVADRGGEPILFGAAAYNGVDTKACAYSTTAKMTIKPGAATTYNIRVKVKDAKGTVANKDFKVTVTK